MNKTLLVLLFLTPFLLFGQPQNIKLKNEKKIVELRDSLKNLSREIKISKDKYEWQNQVLEERLKQASDTIANQNSLFGGFGVLYTIITIVITLLAFALPILTYQFGIKPSRDALKKLEENTDLLFNDFLSKTRNRQIDQSIENIKSKNQELKASSATFLSLTQHEGFSDIQIFKIVQLLKSNELDLNTQATMAHTLVGKKNEFVTEYFKENIILDNNINYSALRHFAFVGLEQFLPIMRKIINDSESKQSTFSIITSYLSIGDKEAIKILLNDEDFINHIDINTINQQKKIVEKQQKHFQLTFDEIKETYFWKKLQEDI